MSKTDGFTLIELIVTITIAAILAALFVQYMGSAFKRSGEPVHNLKNTHEITQVIEKMTAAYEDDLNKDTLDLATFNTNLAGFNANGVTCSGTFLNYRSGENLIDTNGDGTIEPAASVSATNFLLVTATKTAVTGKTISMRVLLTE